MRIVAVPCKASDLQPGDLFSSVGPEFWDNAHTGYNPTTERSGAIGVKTYIRTEVPFDPTAHGYAATDDPTVYRLHIVPTEAQELFDEQNHLRLIPQPKKED